MFHRVGVALVVLFALEAVSLEARAEQVGPPFRVNTYTPGEQYSPSIAALSDGGFIVTWASYGQDRSYTHVYGQRYDGTVDHNPVGSEFLINTVVNGNQGDPRVVALSGGGFAVAWSTWNGGCGVCGQVYDAAGMPVGGNFQVSVGSSGASIASLNDGGFVVVGHTGWPSDPILGQRYSATGAPVGDVFQANTYTECCVDTPHVAALVGDGGFVVTWQSRNAQDGDGSGIFGQRFSTVAERLGIEFQVNTTTAGHQWWPKSAGLNDGGFVVGWTSVAGQDGSGYGVFAQRYDASGERVGSEFPVNTYTTDDQQEPAIAGFANGGFVVAWFSRGQDGSGFGVYTQSYDVAGVPIGPEYQVNTETTGDQYHAAVAVLNSGEYVVVYHSSDQTGQSPARSRIKNRLDSYGQRFNTLLSLKSWKGRHIGAIEPAKVDAILNYLGRTAGAYGPLANLCQRYPGFATVDFEVQLCRETKVNGRFNYTLAFRGNRLFTTQTVSGWITTLNQLIIARGGSQVDYDAASDALAWAQSQLFSAHGDKFDLTLTGHFLGGGLAQYAAAANPKPQRPVRRVVTFNAASLNLKTVRHLPRTAGRMLASAEIIHVINDHDLVPGLWNGLHLGGDVVHVNGDSLSCLTLNQLVLTQNCWRPAFKNHSASNLRSLIRDQR